MSEEKRVLTNEEKERKLNKYLNDCYAKEVGIIAIELAKQFCVTCKNVIPCYHNLFHSCRLPNEEKIKTYGREALNILRKSGLLLYHFRKIVDKKNVVKHYFTENEIVTFITNEHEKPKKLKDVKKLAIDWYEEK